MPTLAAAVLVIGSAAAPAAPAVRHAGSCGLPPAQPGEARPAVPQPREADGRTLACIEERVTVTAFGEGTPLADTPASVAVVERAALLTTASPLVDDALRQVVGFSLFRRTGSRTANPTAQGVSLRGLGASGASRAVVLADGVPQNDPFGGWVYWSRQPLLGLERIEVLRGGAADLYGSGALGGVVQIVSRDAWGSRAVAAELSAGSQATLDAAFSLRLQDGERWGGRIDAEAYTTDGYVPVAATERGAVDRAATSRRLALDTRLERQAASGGRAFARVQLYGEGRGNGTPLQENDTRIGLVVLGTDVVAGAGRGHVRAWGSTQRYEQAFSAVAADRSREDLTRSQHVPADALGVHARWSTPLGARQQLVAGAEARRVSGTSEETVFVHGTATTVLDAGGRDEGLALFVQDVLQPHARLLVSATLRFDAWRLRGGRTITTPLQTGAAAATSHPDRGEQAWSPRLGLLLRARPWLSLTASGYGAFRSPTLNELYRSFRVGDTVTLANPALEPERLWGGEAGALVTRGALALRVTAFSAEVEDAVANVTLSSAPGLVTRERQNVARTRSRGLEAEADLRLGGRALLTAGYALTDAHVLGFPVDPSLDGKRLPQVPRHQATLQARYESRLRLGLQARLTSAAWEDDRNELELGAAGQLDLFAGYALREGLLLFAAVENVTDAEIVAGRTPVPTLAAPRQLRAGLRVTR